MNSFLTSRGVGRWGAGVLFLAFVQCSSAEPDDGNGGDDGARGGGAGSEGAAGSGADSGSGGEGAVEGLAVESKLPAGFLNIDYRAALAVTGARGAVSFERVEGDLPPGISLSSDGVLSGRSRELGEFPFTVRVADEHETLDVELQLEIGRKRWLVYVSYALSTELDTAQLNLVDVSGDVPVVKKTWSGDLSERTTKFSPDGRWLAFCTGPEWHELHVVDLTTDELEPETISSDLDEFEWSPDSRYLAYSEGSSGVLIADVREGFANPVRVGDDIYSRDLLWLGSRFSFSSKGDPGDYTFNFVSVQDGQASGFESLPASENLIVDFDRASSRLSLKNTDFEDSAPDAYCSETSTWVDLAAGRVVPGPRVLTRYSPDLEYVAVFEDDAFRLFEAEDPTGEPLVVTSVASGHCDGVWSPDAKWFATVDEDDALTLLSTNGKPSQVFADESVDWRSGRRLGGTFRGNGDHGFSTDGLWFRYRADDRVFVSRVGDEGPSEPQPASLASTSWASVTDPASRGLVVWDQLEEGEVELRLVDISGTTLGESRVVASFLPFAGDPGDESEEDLERRLLGSMDLTRFTSDSATLVYIVPGANGLSDLYTVDVLEPGAEAHKVSNSECSETHDRCEWIGLVVVQP